MTMSKISYRPSSLHRRERCPGSGKLEAEAGPRPDTDDSDMGTRLHEAVSLGIKFPDNRNDIRAELDQPETEKVNQCWDEAAKFWNQLTPGQRKRAKVLVEKPVDCRMIGIDHDGTPDFAVIVPQTDEEMGIIGVLDWKMGFSYVSPAKYNLQLMAYASALYIEYGIEGHALIGKVQPEISDHAVIAPMSHEELTEFPVGNDHISVPSGLDAYTLPSSEPTYIVPYLPIAGDETISALVNPYHFRLPSGFKA